MANIGVPDEAMRALDAGAEGVGLLRTEFLFLDRAALPDEDEQFSAYSEIAAALKGRPVVIRTLDVGADKPLRFFPQEPEANPFLGIRGLRLGLSEPKLLATQLRAVVRAAQEHPVKVMFPMVAALEELRAARALVDEACRAVGAPERLEVGIMVEVPSAALTADRLAPEVDFFSIGTNDLTQYTMAAERGNSRVASLNDPLHPAVLSLVHRVVEAAEARGRWTGVCGEVAADPVATPVLVGLGVTELSMGAGAIPAIKEMVRDLEWTSAAKLAHAALSCETAAEVRDLATGLSRQDRARADHDPDPEAATPEGA
jgi:phosphocarrier protein FPr